MCGAYGFTIKDAKEVYDRFEVVNALEDLKPRWNVRPGQMNPVGIRLRRDRWMSVMYAEGLNSAKSAVTLQSTDRHEILGEKSAYFQVPL